MASLNGEVSGGNHVLVEVSPDIHICGFCKQQYNNFEVFLAHKQNGCQIPSTDISAPNAGSSLTDSGPEFVFEEAFQACVVKVVKKTLNNAQKAPSKKLKPALTSKRHSCCFSGCTFKTQYGQKDMERHLKTHTGEKPYECELCHKRFSRRDKLNMHSRLHTGEKPHKCKYCAYAAADSSSLKKHLRIHYDERPFKCQICPYASRNSSQLTVHLRSHTGDSPFQCNQCTSKFKINSDLKRHVRIHSGEKPYKCEMCEYRCAMKGNLKPHMQLKHGAENSLRCSDCEFRCATKAALRQHSRQHQPAQPIQCPGCSYSCSSRAALKTHERVHSDERPFRCERCSFASKQRSNLLIHRRKCHSDAAAEKSGGGAGGKGAAGEDLPSRPVGSRYRARLEAARAFRCEACDASFVREDSLRSHRRQHQDQSLQQPPPAQPQTAAAVAPPPPPQAALAAGQLSSYSGAHLKIIIASPLGQDGAAFVPRAKVGAVLLSPEGGHDVLLGPAMQPVNLLTPARHAGPPAGPPAGGALVHQAVLVTHIAPEDGNTLQHQALLQTAEAASQTTGGGGQTFITTCSDLDGLSQLIQEGGTEVTVVTEGNPPVATAASSSSSGPSFSPPPLDVVSPSSSSRDSAKPADPVTLDNGVPGEDGGLVMSDMGPHRTLLIHRVPLVISAQERQAALNPLSPHSIFSDTHTADATED